MAASMWVRCRKTGMKYSLFRCLKRAKITLTSSCYSTQVAHTDVDVEYPPIKPKFPQGKWGYMTPVQAWDWQNEADKIRDVTDVRERVNKLCDIPEKPIWRVNPLSKDPGLLPYQLYLTKTHLIKGMPPVYESINVDQELDELRNIVKDHILYENAALDREKAFTKLRVQSWLHSAKHTQYFIGQVLQSLMSYLSGCHDYLLNAQYDEAVRVAAYWRRHGIPKKGRQNPRYPRSQHSPFQIDHLADCQIRVEKPIPQFVPMESAIATEGEIPNCVYTPPVMGFRSGFMKPSIVPGHWLADPCNFGLLSVHASNMTDNYAEQFGDTAAQDIKSGFGVLSSFAWQASLAHYQGFNMYLDLMYPFCGQTIVTDGRKFTFFCYQLNTLHLWKDDDGNNLKNICWQSEDLSLFDGVENGEVKGFNDDVLRTILRFLLNAPITEQIDLKPTLPKDTPSPSATMPYIPDKPLPPKPEEELPLYVE